MRLARKLNMPVDQMLHTLSSADISEQMAFDMLQNDDYRKKLESKMMTDEERNDALIKMLGGK